MVFKDLASKFRRNPLAFSLVAGFVIRLIAVIFSRGFGMHDDHFLVIEAPGAWAQSTEYDAWLPSSGASTPDGHSFFYSGIHFLFFLFLRSLGLSDPQFTMLLVRLVHALISLGVIYFGYRIAEKISDRTTAGTVALILALLWFMPFLSVRNLIEVVCIPFLMGGVWFLMSADDRKNMLSSVFLAGLLLGIGFCIRFQSVLFIAGLGAGLVLLRQWEKTWVLAAGVISIFLVTQAPIDQLIWGYPFAQFIEYVSYNINHATAYITGPWYNYILLIAGILIPPVSFMFLFGWIRGYKRFLPGFLAVALFLVFHSYFPNKQERFILPIVPFIVVFGLPGWVNWIKGRELRGITRKLIRFSWIFFWTINILLLPFITTMYSKKARVEAMTYLYPKKSEISALVTEDTNRGSAYRSPRFYLDKWVPNYRVGTDFGIDSLAYLIDTVSSDGYPDYILFIGDDHLKQRVSAVENIIPGLTPEAIIEPGFIDRVLFWLNPRNKNDVIHIYRVKGHMEHVSAP